MATQEHNVRYLRLGETHTFRVQRETTLEKYICREGWFDYCLKPTRITGTHPLMFRLGRHTRSPAARTRERLCTTSKPETVKPQ